MDIKFIRQNPEKIKTACRNKGANVDIDKLLKLDEKRRNLIQKVEKIRAERKHGGREQIKELKKKKEEVKKLEEELERIEKDFQTLLSSIPNPPLEEVPIGKDESDNVVVREVGEKTKFDFQPKDYLEIAEKLDLIDVKRAAKVSGTRFGYLKGEVVLLEFALINLAFKTLIKEGFIPVVPPVMIKPEMARGMGYPEQFDGEEAYYLEKDDLYLVGTSEQSIGPMYMNEVLLEKDLPKRYVGFSTCFRREAGSYGKDVRGIIRVHQFDKVEMFSFCHPEKSKEEHQFFLSMQEKLMQLLEIPYCVVQMCTGDLGNPAANKIDIEAWMPGQGQYRETHSTSNCTDFQARRLNIKYRDKKTQKLEFVHTLNGTAFAIGRTIVAIMENYQKKDGTFDWPEVLR